MKYIYLLFSGGKDSTACLQQLLEAGLGKRTKLLYIQSDAAMPEVVDFVRSIVPRVAAVHSVLSNVTQFIDEHGLPSDVVPVENSEIAHFCGSTEHTKIIDRYVCCANNLWKVIDSELLKFNDVEYLVIGDKYCDENKRVFPVVQTAGGSVPVIRPIFFWSNDDVRDYLAGTELWCDRFELDHSSVDCWCCTAYWRSYAERRKFVAKRDGAKGLELTRRMDVVMSAVKKQIKIIEDK